MMISSFARKVMALKQVMGAIEPILQKYRDVNMIFIGGQGEFFEEIKKIGQNINEKLGCEKILFTGPIINAYRLLAKSYMVLGVGRSAFEGMAFGKPTIIVGDNGYAGVVSPDEIEEIAYFNFSGRNNKSMVSPEKLTNEITRILDDQEYYNKLTAFGKDYVKREINIQDGISRILEVYNQNLPYPCQVNRIKRIINIIPILIPIFDR